MQPMTDLSYQAEAKTYGRSLEADASTAPYREPVQLSFSFTEDCTTSNDPDLVDLVMEDVEGTMLERGLPPTSEQRDALRAVVKTMTDMADGVCSPRIMVSDLAPGMGKTTAVTTFLRRLVRSKHHYNVGAVVCVSLVDEIERLVKEADLAADDYAVMWSDPDRLYPTNTPPEEAQILFITQQMLKSRCGTGSFTSCRDFHYLGEARQVRVWDETMDPGEVVTLSTDELGGLLEALRPFKPELADLIGDLQAKLVHTDPGKLLPFPLIPKSLRISPSVLAEALRQRLDTLYRLSGSITRVCSGSGRVRIALDTREGLPSDLAPILVLDASASARGTYSLWGEQLDGPARLPSAAKDYSPLRIHLMSKGAGKQAWRLGGDELAREVAAVIDHKPDEPFLVIHHRKKGGIDPAALIRRYMTTDVSRVSFLPWGRHQATNAYRDIPNVVLAGVLHLPESQHVGLAYASSKLPIHAALEAGSERRVADGEFGHAVLQAAGRGLVRGCYRGQCPPCELYVMTKYSGTEDLLRKLFPGAGVHRWRRQFKRPTGQAAALIEVLHAALEDQPAAPVYFMDLMERLGIEDRSNFNKLCRHPDVKDALEQMSLVKVQLRSSRGYDAFEAQTVAWEAITDDSDVLGSKI